MYELARKIGKTLYNSLLEADGARNDTPQKPPDLTWQITYYDAPLPYLFKTELALLRCANLLSFITIAFESEGQRRLSIAQRHISITNNRKRVGGTYRRVLS